jgi:predicted HTH transcriptional regulator
MPSRLSREQLASLIESQQVEFKKSLSLKKEGMVSLAAMINTEGGKGTVVFGVKPDGTPFGVERGDLDRAQVSLAQHIRDTFDPRLIAEIDLVSCEEVTLLSVSAQRARDVPLHEYDGRAYIREGSSNRALSIAEKAQLNVRRRRDLHTGPWRCDRCPAVVGVLFGMEITDSGIKKSYRCECGGEFWPS